MWIGCSGNFTLERALAGRFRLHSNDVSLYTTALGKYMSGGRVTVKVSRECLDDWGWLDEYLATPLDTAATLMLCTRMLEGLNNPTRYFERIRRGYRTQWPRMHAETVERLEATGLRLASYFTGDVARHFAEAPIGGAVCAFLPLTDTPFKGIDTVFSWRAPKYAAIDHQVLRDLTATMRERKHWLYGTDHRIEADEQWLRGTVQPTSRNPPLYLYASDGPTRIAGPVQETAEVAIPRLGLGDELPDELALVNLTGAQFNALRSQYLDPKIPPSSAGLALGVQAGDKLIGAFAFSSDGARTGEGGGAYLLSDFAVAPDR